MKGIGLPKSGESKELNSNEIPRSNLEFQLRGVGGFLKSYGLRGCQRVYIGSSELSKVPVGHWKFRREQNSNPRTLGRKNAEGHQKFR
jgi:hypothetical protein